MSARSSDLSRVQEIHDIIMQTQEQLSSLDFTEERFLSPADDNDDLLAEGFMNRVFRVTEELGHLTDSIAEKYGFDTHGAKGVRNRLAHVYGQVDKVIIWQVLDQEFNDILKACRTFATDLGIQLDDPADKLKGSFSYDPQPNLESFKSIEEADRIISDGNARFSSAGEMLDSLKR